MMAHEDLERMAEWAEEEITAKEPPIPMHIIAIMFTQRICQKLNLTPIEAGCNLVSL